MTWCIKKVSNNNCTLESLIVMCNYVKINGHGYTPKSGEIKKSLNKRIILPMSENITVTDLSPYTTYSCQGIIVNEAGNSSLSEPVNVTTLEDSKYYLEMHITLYNTDIEYYNIIIFFFQYHLHPFLM